MSSVIRWFLVALSFPAVWHLVLVAGIASVAVLDSLCPSDLVVSGMCTAQWYQPAFEALLAAFSAIAAFSMVVVPVLLAPGHRMAVAFGSFSIGAVVATYFALGGMLWVPFVCAAASGALAILCTHYWCSRVAAHNASARAGSGVGTPSTLTEVFWPHASPSDEDAGRSEDEILRDAINEVARTRAERRKRIGAKIRSARLIRY